MLGSPTKAGKGQGAGGSSRDDQGAEFSDFEGGGGGSSGHDGEDADVLGAGDDDGADGASDDGSSLDETLGANGGGKLNGDSDHDDTCPVCLDEPPNLELLKCHHRLCVGE